MVQPLPSVGHVQRFGRGVKARNRKMRWQEIFQKDNKKIFVLFLIGIVWNKTMFASLLTLL